MSFPQVKVPPPLKMPEKCVFTLRHFMTLYSTLRFFMACLLRRVPPCCKNMCCASRFCTGVGGQQIQASVQGPMKQNASPGEQPEAPRPRWKPGQEQHPGPENQDSQHMLEQPRGYFPETKLKPTKPPSITKHIYIYISNRKDQTENQKEEKTPLLAFDNQKRDVDPKLARLTPPPQKKSRSL